MIRKTMMQAKNFIGFTPCSSQQILMLSALVIFVPRKQAEIWIGIVDSYLYTYRGLFKISTAALPANPRLQLKVRHGSKPSIDCPQRPCTCLVLHAVSVGEEASVQMFGRLRPVCSVKSRYRLRTLQRYTPCR